MILFNFHNSHSCMKELIFAEIKDIATVTQLELHRARTEAPALDSNLHVTRFL